MRDKKVDTEIRVQCPICGRVALQVKEPDGSLRCRSCGEKHKTTYGKPY